MFKRRSIIIPAGDVSVAFQPIGDIVWQQFGPITNTFSHSQFIELDEWITSDENGPKLQNRCSHYKCEASTQVGGVWLKDYSRNIWSGYNDNHHGGVLPNAWMAVSVVGAADQPPLELAPLYYVDNENIPFTRVFSSVDDLVPVALSRLLPGIKSELSLINSLLELKDIKSLFKKLKDILRFLQNALGNVVEYIRRNNIKKLHYTLADYWLELNFGLLPLVSDIRAIIKSLKQLDRKIHAELDNQRKLRRRHFKVTYVSEPLSTLQGPPDVHEYYEGNTYQWQSVTRRETEALTTFHVELIYNYYYSDVQVAHAQLLGLLDMLGVNLNPAIIWNAIPFSFVVDWVFKVGDFLEQFTKRNMEPTINIQTALWSEKTVRTTRYSADVGAHRNLPCSRVKETAYRRQPFMPTAAMIQSSGLTLKEVSLGVALAISLAKHRRAPRMGRKRKK